MKAYVDSSVVLRVVLGASGRLREWTKLTSAISSDLVRVECLRVLDRARLVGAIADRELSRRRATTLRLLEGFELVRMNRPVLERAAEPFPTSIRTLDAIHLATALLVERRVPGLTFATHDEDLAAAARAVGLRVIGA